MPPSLERWAFGGTRALPSPFLLLRGHSGGKERVTRVQGPKRVGLVLALRPTPLTRSLTTGRPHALKKGDTPLTPPPPPPQAVLQLQGGPGRVSPKGVRTRPAQAHSCDPRPSQQHGALSSRRWSYGDTRRPHPVFPPGVLWYPEPHQPPTQASAFCKGLLGRSFILQMFTSKQSSFKHKSTVRRAF